MGYAAWAGWDGAKMILGIAIATCLFHAEQRLAFNCKNTHYAAQHGLWILFFFTFFQVFGQWCVSEKGGQGRVFGIIGPLFGSSLVVATSGYFFMLARSSPAFGSVIGPSDVPSVFDFWYMIAFPMHSKAVGYFTENGSGINIGESNGEGASKSMSF